MEIERIFIEIERVSCEIARIWIGPESILIEIEKIFDWNGKDSKFIGFQLRLEGF